MGTNKIYLTDEQNNSFVQCNGSAYFQFHQMQSRSINLIRINRASEKNKEFSVMNRQNTNIDFDTIEFFVRKARVERSIAITGAFGGLIGMVKNIFSAPATGDVARCR